MRRRNTQMMLTGTAEKEQATPTSKSAISFFANEKINSANAITNRDTKPHINPRISPTRLEVQSLPSESGMGEMGSASLFHFFILRMMA